MGTDGVFYVLTNHSQIVCAVLSDDWDWVRWVVWFLMDGIGRDRMYGDRLMILWLYVLPTLFHG